MTQPDRINKILAKAGFGSRRSVDVLIQNGLVTVNGLPAHIGQKVTAQDNICVKGTRVTWPHEKILLAFNKPKGVTTTKKDRFAKVTVMDFLPPRLKHVFPVGRLDKNSRGLLLLTNDGELALKLTHPRYEHSKEYSVSLIPHKPLSQAAFKRDIHKLATTVINPSVQTKPVTVLHAHYHDTKHRAVVTLALQEGKKRQIRQLFQQLGYEVDDLLRTRIAGVRLEGLKEGEYVTINPASLRL